jgi:glycosyltransferase involved in cell wall biosynthesis
MNILFYTPVNFQCRDVLSLLLELKKNNHNVVLLSQVEKGSFHSFLEANKVHTYSVQSPAKGGPFKILFEVVHLVFFSWRHKIDCIFSHLEPTNIVAVLAQYLVRARVIIFRHHLDLAKLSNFDNSFTYKLTYRLAKKIITVSARSKEYMSSVEKIDSRKIFHVNLGYNFELFPKINQSLVNSIREKYLCNILLITVGRLDKFKRPELAIDILENLIVKHGLDSKLLFLGNGDLEGELKRLVKQKGLSTHVFFLGFIENVMDYLAAGNFLIHPSLSESSSVAIKEAALANLPVIVCKGVGDFDDYLKHDENGFVVHPNDVPNEATSIILNNYQNRDKIRHITASLQQEVTKRFSIQTVLPSYREFIS